MKKRKFDFRFVLIALLVNGGAVFVINLGEGGGSGASLAGVVQLLVSGGVAGFSIPYTIRNSLLQSSALAYLRGGFVMASAVATIGWATHFFFETPDLFGTVLWNFALNFVGGSIIVWSKRNQDKLSPKLRTLVEKL